MIDPSKPNPFLVLGLLTTATKEEIVQRGQELSETAATDEQRLTIRWAMEQLITHPITRLEYELFEIPSTVYEDVEWEQFARKYRRNPVNLNALAKEIETPSLADFNLPLLLRLMLDGLLTTSAGDIRVAVHHAPFAADYGPPPLEVRDVIFG